MDGTRTVERDSRDGDGKRRLHRDERGNRIFEEVGFVRRLVRYVPDPI
jgi:hypothetical protein